LAGPGLDPIRHDIRIDFEMQDPGGGGWHPAVINRAHLQKPERFKLVQRPQQIRF
jgi:hypothetical protein